MNRNAVRWALVVVVLIVATVVALWPRDDDSGSSDSAPDPSTDFVVPDRAALITAAAMQPCPRPAPGAVGAGPLAGIMVPCLDGSGSVDLGAALAGRPALLNLWGPQCQQCVKEMPALAAYGAEPGSVAVIGVEAQEQTDGALHLMARLGVHYPSVSDPGNRLRVVVGARNFLPASFVVHPDGRVEPVLPPTPFEDPADVRAAVERYLG